MSTSQAYPQLDNLYPAPPSSSENGPNASSSSSSNRPAAGPGAGFPSKPPAPPSSAGFGNYSSAGGYGGAGPSSSGVYGNAGRAPGPGSGRGLGDGGEKNVAQLIVDRSNKFQRAYQTLLDRSTPLTTQRWLVTGFLWFLFALIVVIAQGWYIICYALAIYLLNLFLAFLQPKFDPSIQQDLAQDDVEEGAPGLPGAGGSGSSKGGLKGLMNGFSSNNGNSSNNNGDEEEFRPFIRRLPEFKFWLSATKATLLALLATTTRATDIPVYWPILLVYFFTLFGLTMRRQIQHMIKYRYIPFDLGRKATYGSKK